MSTEPLPLPGVGPKAKPTGPEPAPVAAPAKGGLASKAVYLVPFLLAGAGYGLGTTFSSGAQPAASHGTGEEAGASAEFIDDALAAGDFKHGLELIRSATKSASGDGRVALQFREALCQELMGDFASGGDSFAALAQATEGTPRGAAARLGQARCRGRAGRPDDARTILARLVLTSGEAWADSAFLGELFHTKAALEIAQMPRPSSPHPLRLDGLARASRPLDLARHLKWAGPIPKHHAAHGHGEGNAHVHAEAANAPTSHDPTPPPAPHDEPKKTDAHKAPAAHDHPPASPKAEGHAAPPAHAPAPGNGSPPQKIAVQRETPAEQSKVSGRAISTTVPALLADLAAGAGLTLKLLPSAAEAVSGRAVAATVRGLPLADLLDALTEPYGLTWAIAGHDLHVLAEPTDPTALRARARKALKRAAVAEPDHVWVPATLIELGHLDVADGHWPEAAAWYARTVKEYPLGNEGALAAYNWGLTYMNAGDRTKAREQFLNVADRDGPAAALAFWWAGRTHLDCGDTVQAAKLFRRAIAAGADTPAATAAAIGLCVCLYQQDDFAAGHAALRPHKARLKGEGFKETAAFLDALGRQRLAANPKKTGEAEDLFLATVDAPAVSAAGPAGAYLHGQTCRELGLGPRLVAVYETAAAGLRGPLAVRLTAAVAEQHFADGNRAKARDRFLAVAAVDSGPDGKIARLRLAEMDNDTGRFDSALGLCRELIALGDREDATLKQMGRAFEGKKDFARAAQSYAGVVPE